MLAVVACEVAARLAVSAVRCSFYSEQVHHATLFGPARDFAFFKRVCDLCGRCCALIERLAIGAFIRMTDLRHAVGSLAERREVGTFCARQKIVF
eukprot:366424-Chlamydomonas_euryale.AAC.1